MYQAIGVIELKSLAEGICATDAALKSAGVSLVTAHPSCPGKYEIILTGSIADVTAAVDHVSDRFEESIIDASVMGRIDEQVIAALFGDIRSIGINITTYKALFKVEYLSGDYLHTGTPASITLLRAASSATITTSP